MDKLIESIVIRSGDGERTLTFLPPCTYSEIGEAELGALIGDLMHWPAGYHSNIQRVK